MKKARLLDAVFLLFGCMLFSSQQVYAAVVTYDEAISGDLTNGFPYSQSTIIGTFDIGTNTVSGNTSVLTDGTHSDYSDFFIFQIPDGQAITSALLYFGNVTGYSSFQTVFIEIHDIPSSSGTTLASMQISPSVQIQPATPFDSALPSGAGTYGVILPSAYGWSGDVNMDYTWQFEVTAIPIPPALWLFGSGLLGLIGIARKKST